GVAGFVLVAARAYSPVHVDALYRVLALPAFGRGLAALLAPLIGPQRVEDGIRSSLGPDAALASADFMAVRARLWTRPTVVVTLSEERTSLATALDAQSPRYPEIRTPVTIVCGDQDDPHTEQARRDRKSVV